MATKVMIENAVLLTAEIRAEKVQKDGKWVDTGNEKLELVVLCDAYKDDLASGKIRTITSPKDCSFDLKAVLSKLQRYAVLNICANLVEYKDRNAFTIYSVTDKDGVMLTSRSDDENATVPF